MNTEVAGIVQNCKLPPEADAQLHIVVAELMAGAYALIVPLRSGWAFRTLFLAVAKQRGVDEQEVQGMRIDGVRAFSSNTKRRV